MPQRIISFLLERKVALSGKKPDDCDTCDGTSNKQKTTNTATASKNQQPKAPMVKLAAVVASLLVVGAHAISSSGSSVLVLLEPKLKRDDYSVFFNGLQGALLLTAADVLNTSNF